MLGHADLSASSRQVSSSDSSGGAIANLGTAHQRRLLIPLARTVALAFAQNDLVQAMHDVQSQAEADVHDGRELEGSAAALKVANAAHTTVTIQACREACGGLPAGQPFCTSQCGYRRLHDLRGGQHRPAPVGHQGAAHQPSGLLRVDGLTGHGALRCQAVRGCGHRARDRRLGCPTPDQRRSRPRRR